MILRLSSVLALVLAVSSVARADTITLDSGAELQGDLARFEFGGDCQISVAEGELAGVIVIVPCHRVASFVRTNPRMPVAIGVVGGPGSPEAAPAAIEAQAAAKVGAPSAAKVGAPSAAKVAAAPQAVAAPPSGARSVVIGDPAADAVANVPTEVIAAAPSTSGAPFDEEGAPEQAPEEAPEARSFFDDLLGSSPFDEAQPDPESPAAMTAPSIVANGPQAVSDVNARTTTPAAANQPRPAPTMGEPPAEDEPPARTVSF